jgi:Uma2 family endonuclease
MTPSFHHAYLSSNLIALLHKFEQYSIFSELTLQINGKDYIPAISVYYKTKVNFLAGDIIKMTEMPLLAVEILSPSQGMQEMLDKFEIYFGAGIKSCWLVVPIPQSVIVYSSLQRAKTFYQADVADEIIGITLSFSELFS